MAEASFPTSPAFNEQFIPAPPTWVKEEMSADEYLGKLSTFMSGQYLGLRNLQNSIASGWLISTLRVLDLTADTITAGSIFTQDLYLGADGNGSIRLGGTDTLIEVVDEAGTTRVAIGDFGTSNDNWGIQVSNAAGTVIFQSTSSTFINGAVITDATITNAKIFDMAGNKLTGSGFIDTTQLADLAVTNAKVNDLSAVKLTTGQLNVNSSGGVSVLVDGGGDFLVDDGGDIICRPATSNAALLRFQTSGGSDRMTLGYLTSGFPFGGGAYSIITDSATSIVMTANNYVVINGGTAAGTTCDFIPGTDNAYNNGTASLRWALVRGVTITPGDLRFENDYVLTEPDMVYTWEQPDSGLYIMNDDWVPIGKITKKGDLKMSGRISDGHYFPMPDIPRREPTEREHAKLT